MSLWWLLPSMLAALAASAVFSGFETGIYTVNRLRLDLRGRRKSDRTARTLSALIGRQDELLCVLLIGNNLANGAAAMLGEAWMRSLLSEEHAGESPYLATLVLTPLLFLSSEALPKHLFHLHTETWTYRLAPLVALVGRVLAPLSLLVQPAARIALRLATGRTTLSGLGKQLRALEGLLEATGKGVDPSLRHRAVQLRLRQDRSVRHCMIPLERAAILSEEDTVEELGTMLKRRPYRRYPLRDSEGGFSRYVYFLDPFRGKPGSRLADHSHPLLPMSPETPLAKALAALESSDSRMGIVRSGDGTCLGFVTAGELAQGLLEI